MEAGGVAQLEKLMQELPELLQRNTDLLNESERMLREEKDSDDKLRAQYKVGQAGSPSIFTIRLDIEIVQLDLIIFVTNFFLLLQYPVFQPDIW